MQILTSQMQNWQTRSYAMQQHIHNSICKLMSFVFFIIFSANSFNAKLIEKEGSLDHDKQLVFNNAKILLSIS